MYVCCFFFFSLCFVIGVFLIILLIWFYGLILYLICYCLVYYLILSFLGHAAIAAATFRPCAIAHHHFGFLTLLNAAKTERCKGLHIAMPLPLLSLFFLYKLIRNKFHYVGIFYYLCSACDNQNF